MPNKLDPPTPSDLFNPFLLWADLGMRAAEAAVASTQNITEGADRLTRAVASADADETVGTSSGADEGAGASPAAGMGGIASMQRLAWELMAQNWMRWVSAVNELMSAGAGVTLARKVAGQGNPLEAARHSLRPVAWVDKPATNKDRSTGTSPSRRSDSRGGTRAAQHAMASGEPKPRRKTAAKSRRTQRASRASRR